MLSFKTWLTSTLSNDATLQGLLGASSVNTMPVYQLGVDLQPEVFPAITYHEIHVAVMSRPQGAHVGVIELDIWSTQNALEVETIYERCGQLLNFKDSTTQTLAGTLWWIREQGATDDHTTERRLWHKSVELKFWSSKSDNT